MHIMMRFGKKGLPLDLPDDLDVTVIRKPEMPVLADPEQAVRDALARPVDCKSLMEEAAGKKNICILICDVTRPVPNGTVLPVLIEGLVQAGTDKSSITILVATGLHRPNEGEELRQIVGNDEILKTIRIENHFARNDEDHVFLGTTPRGMPVRFDRRFVDADLRIVTGLVEPHFMAGYSGGRKVIIPGIAHQDTIRALHASRLLQHEGVANCVLEGNPLHEEQIAAVRLLGRTLAVNTVIDENRNLSFVNFGELEKSHSGAVSFARPYLEVAVDRKFATVVTSAAGFPLDRNYYQTVKGMVAVTDILEPGANLIIVSECSEGLGTGEYAEAQARLLSLGGDRFLEDSAQREFASIDEWESVMQIKAMKMGSIHLYTGGLSSEDRALTGVCMVDSVVDRIAQSVREKQDRHVAVVPEGPYVIPKYRSL